ncbi:MAG: glycosyltransferase family 2 protein, partial [Actinomycetota bacterium]
MADAVTIVVATRNRRDELARTLPRHEAPVVVVDNGSSDGTAAAARAVPSVIEVVELRRNRGAYGRTIGATRARTPYVAFADDDSWWAPGSLERAVKVLQEYPRLAVLAAQVRVMPQDELDPLCRSMAESPFGRPDDLPGSAVLGFMACAAVVHRGAFLAVGGFDDIVRFPGEEERVALDLAAAGLGLAYVPEVVAYHEPSPRRENPDLRAARVTRSRLLTALQRRPWSAVGRDA